ncbi:MAG: tetratricopeptide repeat protein [Nitrospinales bacterium]
MALQKQFKRKDLKNPDMLHVLTVRFFKFYEKSKWLFIGSVFLVTAVGVGVLAFQYNSQLHEKKMETLYFQMVKIWANEKDKSLGNAITKLQDIISKIDDSKVKQRANLLLADAMYESKKYDSALPIYTNVKNLSKMGDLDFDLARVGMAHTLEAKAEYTKAIEIFKSIVIGNSNYPLFYIYLGMARCYLSLDDSKNVELVLREALDKFPDHADIAKLQLMLNDLEKGSE